MKTLRPHLGGVLRLQYALNFLAVLCAALFATIMISPSAHAADAEWQSGSLMYDGKSFQGPAKADRAAAQRFGIPENSQFFEHIDTTSTPKKSQIIFFGPGDDLKDATSGQLAEFTYDDSGTEDKYTSTGSPRAISVDKDSYETGGAKEETSCTVSGIGYIICPIMDFIAGTVDKVYDVLKRFLEVKPLSGDPDSSLKKAWSIVLSIANVLFIIGFIVIIYSYVSNQGVSQYDVRSIVPRLVIAAVLMNVSFYICALAVDASNVLGAAIQDMFIDIRKGVVPNDVVDNTSWSQAATFILSGGTIGAIAGLAALAPSGTASLTFLIPVLVTVAIAIFVAVAVLAARQALITILIVVAPIAFAAFILPSTQKYFDKWRSLFVTMLIMYPIFAILFGGSQLAATLVAQNANRMEVILFAMFIQVIPLALTPFLIKLSGGLLGRFAGIVNNPAKGLGDRANNWGKQKRDEAKDRRLQEANRGWRRTPGLAFTQRMDERKRRREGMQKYHQAMRQAQFDETTTGRMLADRHAEAQMAQTTADNFNKAQFAERKMREDGLRAAALREKVSHMQLDVNNAKVDTYIKELESHGGYEHHRGDVAADRFGTRMHELARDSMVQASRQSMADAVHRSEYADDILENPGLAADAGGIKGAAGASLALANATQTIRKDFGEGVAAQTELLKHFSKDLDNANLKNLALGGTAVGKDSQGRSYTFDASNIGGDLHEASVAKYLQETNYDGAKAIIKAASDGGWDGMYGTVKDAVIKIHGSKAPFLSGQSLDVIDQGGATSAGGYNNMIISYINKGKFSGQSLAGADAQALEDMLKVMYAQKQHDPSLLGPEVASFPPDFQMHVDGLIQTAREALADPNIQANISETNREKLLAMKHLNRIHHP